MNIDTFFQLTDPLFQFIQIEMQILKDLKREGITYQKV